MRQTILAAAIIGALFGGVALTDAHAEDVTTVYVTKPHDPAWMSRPCKTEASVNCYWNAHQMGNKKGHSFYVRAFPGRSMVTCWFYVNQRYAHKHDYCIAP